MGAFGRSFRALMQRNFIYRKRRWIGSIFEFILPILFITILLAIKASVSDTDGFRQEVVEPAFPDQTAIPLSFADYVKALQVERVCLADEFDGFTISGLPYEGYGWTVPFVRCDARKCKENLESAIPFCEFPLLGVASSEFADDRVKKFVAYLESSYPMIFNASAMPNNRYFLKQFDSDTQMEQYVKLESYGNRNTPKIGVGIVFSGGTSDKEYPYSIRVNSTGFNSPEGEARPTAQTTPPTNRLLKSFAKNDVSSCSPSEGGNPRLGPFEESCTGQYIYNGAITIQRLVDDFIIEDSGAKDAGWSVASNGVTFSAFPTRKYTKDGFYAAIAPFAPLLVILGLLYPVSSMIRSLTIEKELRQKELMKMMSVPDAAIGWSWFTSFIMFYGLSAFFTALVTSALYEKASIILLIIFWELSFLATILFSFFVSSLFTKATRATLVGILGYFVGYFLSISVSYQDSSSGIIALVSLHPVVPFAYGLQIIGELEDSGIGLTGTSFNESDYPSGYTFASAIGGLIADIFIYGVLTWYLNRVVPSDFGTPLPWYFPFQKAYWCGGEASHAVEETAAVENDLIPIEPVSDALKEQEKDGRCVQLRNLSRTFGTKTAVDGLSLSMYSGQVTALLGHNGAGKTTTISMLTGMVAPSSGTAFVAGKDIRTQMSDIREGVGICLQHDCLFPLLTVKEHIEFFAKVKGLHLRKSKEEFEQSVLTSIEDVALLEKRNTFSKDLSGGMKRKLSVAIAFCGDSKVVFLDEPTSGMDPFSRRFTWNVIRQYRQDRCIVLTTHFMDEADLLGDRIAIMAEGQLRCAGSPLFLKKSFGVGYQLTIEKRPQANGESKRGEQNDIEDKLKNIVIGGVPEATVLSNVGSEMSFQLPLGASTKFVDMFGELDRKVESREIITYGISITTLDEVFLMVARGEYGADKKEEYPSVRARPDAPFGDDNTMTRSHHSKMDLEKDGLFFRHCQALFAKRAMNFKRDKKAWVCSTICPSFFVMLGFLLVIFGSPTRDMESLTLTLDQLNPDVTSEPINPIPFNEAPGNFSCQPGVCFQMEAVWDIPQTEEFYGYCGDMVSIETDLRTALCSISDTNDIMETSEGTGIPTDASTVQEASFAIYKSSESFASTQYGALYFTHDSSSTINASNVAPPGTSYNDAAFQACTNNPGNYTTEDDCENFRGIGYDVRYNFTALHSSLLYQAVADEAIVRNAIGSQDFSILATIHPLPITRFEEKAGAAQDSFSAWFLLVLSFPFITGSFASFIVAEKMSKAKHLQTVSGVTPSAYWLSSYVWDVINYQLPCWTVIVLIFAMDIESFSTTNRGVAGGVIATLFFFGPAATGFTYIVSFFFTSPSMCNLFVIVFNFFIGMAGPLVVLILRLIGSDPVNPKDLLVNIAITIEWILRFIPSFNLGKSLLFVINIEYFERLKGKPITVWDSQVLLIEVIFLIIQSVAYIAVAIKMDKWATNPAFVQNLKRILTCKRATNNLSGGDDTDVSKDEDVIAEADRVLNGGANEDLIVLNNLVKRYPNGKLAVNNMSLGIPPGQCFGLLGINGAGKTTTMSILTAEFPPTSGDATLAGFSVTREPEQTRRRTGYCPQFDAHFMNLTGVEHVELYASIKGVPKELVKEAASSMLAEVGLNEFDRNKLSSGYSGGMKRKLSVACAMVGQPQIVFLDEPSTGMDPVARRAMWGVISNIVAGNDNGNPEDKPSVILTTHSMEECEALCPQIGIMAGGKLRCLGSAQHLKSRFGKGFQVELKLANVNDDDEDFQAAEKAIVLSVGLDENMDDVEAAHAFAEATFLNLEKAKNAVTSLTGNEDLANMIDGANPTGYVVYKSASSDIGVSADELAVFAVEEMRMKAVLDFFQSQYGETAVLRERQDSKVRFEVGSENIKVSALFGDIEEHKERLHLTDYGVSQTSLEQVFNMHAAEAEERKHNTDDG
eukprot:CAMPEP_0198282180 /NCGR_PEP_ID=MMETSP1449-20131203/2021_1 /TAXON_ID=420275 /ORGANISM="Attheya septentrionalis, Strain CCMP2084" /LENGTH=1933 /DNA_ID=CAMNT_0043978311 /DNA_START=256 /DNA_END=6057 /DNA_ORIENTATION=+